MREILINGKRINDQSNCYVIAEVGQSHEGSLGMAHAFIDCIADAGADAVKFQTHIAAAESTIDEPWRVKFSSQDLTRYDYWKRMEFTEEQWLGLAEHARKRNLVFLSSPFSVEAVKMLDKIGMPAWKIASGEISNMELMESIWATGKPALFSTGMCNFDELDSIVKLTRSRKIPFGIFQCTSEYPCQPENWGLNLIDELRKRYNCPVGFSDHSGSICAGLAAATLGAYFIEVHVTFSYQMFGPDVAASITFEDLCRLVQGVKQIRASLNSPVQKNEMAKKMSALKNIFGRSLALLEDLPADTIVRREDLTLKKPGTGIPYFRLNELIGKRLRHDKASMHLLKEEDFE